jgi:4-amino-4-deoxy-L-arabinose transferase-like glycosyltransferase
MPPSTDSLLHAVLNDLAQPKLITVQRSKARPQAPWLIWGLIGLFCGLLFWQLWAIPLFDVDEPRYAQTAREMMQRQDWITPYFNGKVRFDKPVLYYWLIAFSYQLFGMSEWSTRLVSVLATIATTVGLWWGCRPFAGAMAPIISLVFMCSLLVMGIGRMSITDMTLTLWMTWTTLAAYRGTLPGQAKWWLLAGVFAGLGLLTKGPVALVLPGFIVLLTTVVQKRFKASFISIWPWLASVLAVLLALPWYSACYMANGQAFVNALLLHNVTRFEGVVSGHDQAWYFYGVVLLVGALPWSAFLPVAVKTVWVNRQSLLAPDRLAQFGLIWLATVFVFFQVAQTKLLTYILPLFPAMAIVVNYAWQRASQQSLLLALRATLVFTLLTITIMGIIGLDRFLPNEAAGTGLNSMVWWVGLALAIGLVVADRFLVRSARLLSMTSLCGGWLVAVAVTITGILPHVSRVTHAPVQFVRDYVAQQGRMPVMTYQMQRPSLTYYLNQPVPGLFKLSQVQQQLQALLPGQAALLLSKQRFHTDVQTAFPMCMVIRQSDVYVLFRCEPTG